MSAELNRLEQLFHAALELASPEERAKYLAQACGADTALRERVERLLRAHETAGKFLNPDDSPSQKGLAFTAVDVLPGEKPGDQIGRYRLVERIGEGGYCVVYLAEQAEPVRRQVALKVIKAGMDTRQVNARFDVERQALALMDHPHIAKVFDAGVTSSGRPYVVMEFVRGVPITQYCDQHQLTVKQRLELFMQVCHAVQHAHQKGIIHRDLKPSNILVTEAGNHGCTRIYTDKGKEQEPDGVAWSAGLETGDTGRERSGRSRPHEAPAPKVIDFGIAKAMQAGIADKAVATWAGQFVGTPAYMSPEQASMSNDIDVRTDIYSLGVLLYELLSGVTPLDQETLADVGFDEIRRMVQETDPPKPSARLLGLGQKLAEVAQLRETEPGVLRRCVKGDLDCIVMKALEKDRQRRYETANEFAEDIQRHLDHLPVLASSPSTVYLARKFVRRHRVGVLVILTVTLALLAGLSLALVGRHRAVLAEREMRRERDRAVQAEAETRVILDVLSDKLSAGEGTIPLLHASARIARDRLGPTNPASLRFLLPSAQNLGRLGAWTNALEVYRWLIETDPNNLEYWERAHVAAVAGAQPEASARLRQGVVQRFGDSEDPARCLVVARMLLITPDKTYLQTAIKCAARGQEKGLEDLSSRMVQGIAEYRRGNWAEALQLLKPLEHCPDLNLGTLACAFGAMARHQDGEMTGAKAALDRASELVQLPLRMGQLQAKDWPDLVLALAARSEAERLILGREVSPPVTAASLALAREIWKCTRESVARGEVLAREGNWKESRDAYAQALQHPAFDWDAAEEQSFGRCLSLHMATVFVRAGDTNNFARLCRLLLALHPEKPTTPKQERDATVRANRYSRACFLYARGLSPELKAGALALARFAVENQRLRGDHARIWVCQSGGIAEYHAGDPAEALPLLLEAEEYKRTFVAGPAMLYRAMVLHTLHHPEEAAQVLQDAETMFSGSPDLNQRAYWWDVEAYKLALEEARALIR